MSVPVLIDDATVLAVLAELGGAKACLDAAADAASVVEHASVAALHVRVDPMTDILPSEEFMGRRERHQLDLQEAHEGKELAAIFSAWSAGLPRHLHPEWHEVRGGEAKEVEETVQSVMLAVMANLDAKSGGHPRRAFHTCMMATGKPFLVVPRDYTSRRVRSILVSWKDSKDSRRVIEAAEPWLAHVESVNLLRIGTGDPLEDQWVQEKLADAGTNVHVIDQPKESGIKIGDQVLDEARRLEADWIVAGAYHHGETLEWLLGGVSETLVSKADRPVFFMH